MILFVMFAILFSYVLAERDFLEPFQAQPTDSDQSPKNPRPKEPLLNTLIPEMDLESIGQEELLHLSREVIKETNLQNVEITLESDNTVKISVHGPMLFNLGKADLRPETQRFLNEIAGVLNKIENEIVVVGHTDNYPISSSQFPTNWELSAGRATRIIRYLISRGVKPDRFTAQAHAMYRPKLPNSTKLNKQKNRRVEIIIKRNIYTG